jgi:anti-sigma factor RsiW
MALDQTDAGEACEPMLLLMSGALDSRLSAYEQRVLSGHLTGCAACRRYSLELEGVDLLVRAVVSPTQTPLAPDLDFVQQVMAQVRLNKVPLGGVRAFALRVAQDPSMQEQFRQAANLESFIEQFVHTGQQQGYLFGSGEVVQLLNAERAANDDLSDWQLDAVVGGAGVNDAALHSFICELHRLFKPID